MVKKAKIATVQIITGIIILLGSLWGSTYGFHYIGKDWAELAWFFTGAVGCLSGIFIASAGLANILNANLRSVDFDF